MTQTTESNCLKTDFASLKLDRLPLRKKETLRAWDAADEYLLKQFYEDQKTDNTNVPLLIINDQFGALACSLNDYKPTSWSDSFIAHQATKHNLDANTLENNITCLPSTESPKNTVKTVLIKVPKTLALLEQQLSQLRNHISEDTRIIAAGMSKHIHRSTLQIFEKLIGQTHTSLAIKKARLIFCQLDSTLSPKPPNYPCSFYEPSLDLELSNHANVFAKEKLDIGARFFIDQFNQLPDANHLIDLGCGNGVLGIVAQRQLAESHISFVDESYMAIESAQNNYQRYFPESSADFYHSDSLSQLPKPNKPASQPDLILCNPPFHQQHAIGDHIAWEMFSQSKQCLASRGELWVVANRHLGYHTKLKRLFNNCRTVAANKKFVVLAARN
jgi:16S rRNA (guanine1207-N2)-methyltransferase